MMVLFRASFITAAFVCAVAVIGQFATVHAAPQFGMRPKLHVLGAEGSGSEFDSLVPATATASVDADASETAAPTTEATQPPDNSSSDDTGTELAAQTNSAASCASRVGIALFAGSIAAIVQVF